MEKLLELLFDILLGTGYLTIIFIGVLLIQLISYRVFKFNIYKFLKYILVDKEMER